MGKGMLWGMIDAQPIFVPAVVEELNAATLVFSVPAPAARALVPGDGFEVIESAPGTVHLVVAAHDNRRGAWGPCVTFDLGIRARPAAAPEAPTGLFLCPGPMAHGIVREAAHRALGLPKTDGEVEAGYTDDTVTFSLSAEGRRDLTLRLPRARSAVDPAPVDLVAYTYVDGEPSATSFEMKMPIGIVDPAEVVVELGTGPMTDSLRRMGLPRAPDLALWGEGLTAAFHLPQPVATPTPAEGPANGGTAPGCDDGRSPGAPALAAAAERPQGAARPS